MDSGHEDLQTGAAGSRREMFLGSQTGGSFICSRRRRRRPASPPPHVTQSHPATPLAPSVQEEKRFFLSFPSRVDEQ